METKSYNDYKYLAIVCFISGILITVTTTTHVAAVFLAGLFYLIGIGYSIASLVIWRKSKQAPVNEEKSDEESV